MKENAREFSRAEGWSSNDGTGWWLVNNAAERPRVLVAGPFGRPFITDWYRASSEVSQCIAVDLSGDARAALRSDIRRKTPKVRPSRVFEPLNDRMLTRDLKRQLNDVGFQPDLIHSHFYSCGYSLLGLQQELQVPFVHTEHSSTLVAAQVSSRVRRRVGSVMRAASTVFAVGPGVAETLAQIEPDVEINITGNPVPVPPLGKKSPRTQGLLRICSAANLIELKRVGLQLAVLDSLARLVPDTDACLAIAGSGQEEARLRRASVNLLRSSSVEFLGELPRRDLWDLMAQSDVFLHTSQTETFGVVLVEAMLQGTPVVATSCGGVTDLADDLPGLLVVDQGASPDAIARAILETQERAVDASEIRDAALLRFGYVSVVDAIARCYSKALGETHEQ